MILSTTYHRFWWVAFVPLALSIIIALGMKIPLFLLKKPHVSSWIKSSLIFYLLFPSLIKTFGFSLFNLEPWKFQSLWVKSRRCMSFSRSWAAPLLMMASFTRYSEINFNYSFLAYSRSVNIFFRKNSSWHSSGTETCGISLPTGYVICESSWISFFLFTKQLLNFVF